MQICSQFYRIATGETAADAIVPSIMYFENTGRPNPFGLRQCQGAPLVVFSDQRGGNVRPIQIPLGNGWTDYCVFLVCRDVQVRLNQTRFSDDWLPEIALGSRARVGGRPVIRGSGLHS